MRLIDADELIKQLDYCAWNSATEVVEAQPTAYDVDKVVEELEELKMQAKKDMQLSDNIADANAYGGKMIAYDVAIDIVRKGGSKNE